MEMPLKWTTFLGAVCFCMLLALVDGSTIKWLHLVDYGSSVDIDCNTNRTLNANTADDIAWILPDNKQVANGYNDGKLIVTNNGANLRIERVSAADTGFYHCLLVNGTQRLLVKRGLNIYGPEWNNLAEVYKYGAFVGGIAAAVLLVLISGACLVYKFRWVDPAKRNRRKYGAQPLPPKNGIVNQGAIVGVEMVEVTTEPAAPSVIQTTETVTTVESVEKTEL
ncbi:uncharacterized protein LOC141910215 [Tubulanus polymorphus]|uniref:uncharacterized protein LOC141910215 n=1 Tax=Tubulanus polymorphus TaxID=672921 RepID=UPI003DA648CE